jgi:predicted NAD/FAD-binding protein
MEPQQRVAIVGSGLAGLVSAHLLHNDRRQRYAVKVFESV